MMAAIVHLCGCTFYAVFASGELQPWAEPTAEEQESWTHTASMKKPMSPKIQETAFVSCCHLPISLTLFSLSLHEIGWQSIHTNKQCSNGQLWSSGLTCF